MSEPTTTFADFDLDPALCDSLAEVGITTPFPIQELTLPLALGGADIIGQARTGTGKTLGFGLPMLQRTDVDAGLQTLVIVPTRELCLQVSEDLAQAGKGKGVKVVAIYGGKAMQPQIDAIAAGAHLVVGTPGRLLDLSRRGFLDLSQCSGLVLDEADEMLDLGFLPDVETLIEMCASSRQTLLFSATMPAAIVALARRYMTKPTFMRAEVEEVQIAPQTKQHFFSCHRMDKPAVLARILQTPDRGLCVVFCRTKRMADILADELRDRDVKAAAIHSGLRQEARERALDKFRKGSITVLCATEVAARGLDIDDVTHVVNYDCPDDEKMYLHRIGRTGRAGAAGVAITFALYNEIARLEMIRRELDVEEEIVEVFSTSPLLDELFDLPPREEKKKVASPPPARRGAQSRSSRRSSKADRDAAPRKTRAAKAERDTTDEDAPADRGEARTPRRSEPARSDGRTITRTRTRRRSGSSSDGGATETKVRSDEDATSEESAPRRRTRTRTDAGASAGSKRADTTDAAEGSDDGGEQTERSTRTRTRSGRGDRGGSRAQGSGRASGDAKSGGSKSGGSKSGGSKRSGGGSRNADGARSGRGSKDGGVSKSGGGDQGTRRSGGRSRQRNGESSERERSGGTRQPRARKPRQAVDAAEARGDGQPRLRRQMEMTHLP